MIDFLIITLTILLITRWFQAKPRYWKNSGISYDSTPVPIFGSLSSACYSTFSEIISNLYKKMGNSPMYGIYFLQKPCLLIRDPKLIKRVTIREADKFMDRPIHSESYDPMSKGLFFTQGEEWKQYRTKMTPYFTPSRIKGMYPFVKPIAEDYTKHLCENGRSGPVEIHSACMKFSVDVIMTTVFGVEPDSFKNPNSFFYGLQRELLSFFFGIKLLLGLLSPYIYRCLGFCILTKRTNEKMKKLMSDIINQRIRGIGVRQDFVQGMVDLMDKEESTKSECPLEINKPTQAKFDLFSVTGQCMLMYAAGTETTGNTLAFLLYELALNQDSQQKAREEIISMVKRTNDQYDVEDLHSLHYVNMVLKEALRKYPVLVFVSRICNDTIDLNGLKISPGLMIIVPTIGLHYDPEFFPEPEKFIPERFADDSTIIPGTYLPFGIGPRICIGMKLAQTEIILALCKLLPKYKVTPSNKSIGPLKYSRNPTLSPANGIWLNIEEIC